MRDFGGAVGSQFLKHPVRFKVGPAWALIIDPEGSLTAVGARQPRGASDRLAG